MGEREGGRKGRSSRYSDDLTVFSLFLFLSMRVRVYIREREDDDKGRQREGDRCEEAIFYLDFCPADSLSLSLSPKKEGPVKMHKNRRPMSEE